MKNAGEDSHAFNPQEETIMKGGPMKLSAEKSTGIWVELLDIRDDGDGGGPGSRGFMGSAGRG